MPRPLFALLCVVLYLDAALFGTLIPLLPGYVDEFDLSKLESGAFFAAYGAGALAGGIPVGLLAARVGPKRSVIVGFVVLSAATLTFALAGDPVTLGIARFAQGLGSIATWSGALAWIAVETPRERRGQQLGTAFGFAVFGFIAGPALGAIARITSVRAAFLVITLVALVLAITIARQRPARVQQVRPGAVRRALADERFLAGLWLNALPAMFFGVLDLLATLDLDAGGYGPIAIAAIFSTAGLLETGGNPLLGRITDRHGKRAPVSYALAASVVVAAAFAATSVAWIVAILVVAASLSFGGFYTPGMALVADRADAAGLSQGLGFGVTNTVWASGATVGPLVGGSLAEATTDAVPYALCAALCAVTLIGIVRRAGPVPLFGHRRGA